MSNARFNFMHFMPYVHLPPNHKEYKSLWVNFPNKYYDPEKAHALYQQYLSQLVLADRLGFDAIVVNEHHNTSYSMMPAPSLIAAMLIPQIQNARICVWGTPPIWSIPIGWRKNMRCLTCSRRGGWRWHFRSAPAWNIGPIRSIPSPRGKDIENRSTSY